MSAIKDALHEKERQRKSISNSSGRMGEQQVRYTAMMPDVPFMVLGLSCDIGWIMHLTAG